VPEPPRDPWWLRCAAWFGPPSGRDGFSFFAFLLWGSAVMTVVAAVCWPAVALLSGNPEHRQTAWATVLAALILAAAHLLVTIVRRPK
jgi:uncharacterized membrane protein YvlD (DUF360 family)